MVTEGELRAIAASMVVVQVHGTVARPGLTELHLAVCPPDVEESDVFSVQLDLR